MSVVVARVVDTPLDRDDLERRATRASDGAVVTFAGVVRDHDGGRGVIALEYSAHPDAERFLRACCDEVAASGCGVAAVHRTGALVVGDVALVVVVTAAHRAEAFTAAARLVDLIKQRVPIWKRQRFTDGESEWVGL